MTPADQEPLTANTAVGARLVLVALVKRFPGMTDAEARQGYEASEVRSEETDLHAGELERKNLND